MNWRRWKLGFFIALLCAAFTAGAALVDPQITWRGIVAVFCTACLTNLGNFLVKHPIEDISSDTTISEKPKQ